jgi:hypothetical protein
MIQHDLRAAHWQKSSYSNGNGGDCVEVAIGLPGLVPVRDTKNAGGPALFIPDTAWAAFLVAAENDGFA